MSDRSQTADLNQAEAYDTAPLIRPTENCEEDTSNGQENPAEEGLEGRPGKGLRAPVRPNKQEVEDHETCHVPFRSWCAHCVRGKSNAPPHRQKEEDESTKPVVSIDYAYLGIKSGTYRVYCRDTLEAEKEAERQGHSQSLVMVDSASKCLFA